MIEVEDKEKSQINIHKLKADQIVKRKRLITVFRLQVHTILRNYCDIFSIIALIWESNIHIIFMFECLQSNKNTKV